jgi:multiple sugar transport system ATP-binding protein
MTLGDRVAVLRKGLLQQVATPRVLYEHPLNMFVAGFIGSPPMNFIPGTIEGGKLSLPFLSIALPDDMQAAAGDRDHVMIGIRPELFEDATLIEAGKEGKGVTFMENDNRWHYMRLTPDTYRLAMAELEGE